MTREQELLKRALPALRNWEVFATKAGLEGADLVANDIVAYFSEAGIDPYKKDKDTIDMFGGDK